MTQLSSNAVDRTESERNLDSTTRGLSWWAALTVAVIIAHSIWNSQEGKWPGILSVINSSSFGVALSLAAAAIGSLIGFLFGVPRTLQLEHAQPGGAQPASPRRQAVNTNVEKVSDWLTTIIVGLGLAHITALPDQLKRLGDYFAYNGYVPSSFYVATTLNGAVLGFFMGYLLTRLFLAGAFIKVDTAPETAVSEARKFERFSEHSSAVASLQTALQSLEEQPSKPLTKEIYEGLLYNSLFEDPPAGFNQALRYAEEYLSKYGPPQSASFYVYLASAYGQKFKWLKERAGSVADFEATRKSAFEAAKKALSLDSSIKPLLQRLLEPAEYSEDRDLEPFREDPEFRRLLFG
jgi:hypothetical protein